ncbi:MAG: sigma 54-interacting transcriptional regulator [Bilophila wadsworthia]
MPDVRESLIAFYKLLKETFPLEGMVMHHFLPSSQSLLELHFIHDGGIHFLGRFIPFSREQTMFLRAFSLTGGVNAITNSQDVRTAESVNNDLREFIENRPRAHLVCCLKGAGAPLGLLRLIGTEVGCFTEEHERRLEPAGDSAASRWSRCSVRRRCSGSSPRTARYAPRSRRTTTRAAELIGTSGRAQGVMETVRKLSGTDAPVLILGETGTGKGLSPTRSKPDRSAWASPSSRSVRGHPETLMDSTLFGHEKGAFTGAHCAVGGKFELANGGTLFLDELGELSLQAQVRLLRTLQNHVVERVGSTTSIPVDVRIIAATNRDLHKMLREGTFREDLYHRLNVFTISVPPLRERLQDLLPLARHFIDKATRRLGLPPISGIEPDSAERLLQYDWPGNVRELENLVERAVILDYNSKLKLDRYLQPVLEHAVPGRPAPEHGEALEGRVRELVRRCFAEWMEKGMPPEAGGAVPSRSGREHRPDNAAGRGEARLSEKTGAASVGAASGFSEFRSEAALRSLDDVVREHIEAALDRTGGKIHGPGGAGELLGVHPDTLRKKMKKMGIVRPSGRREGR